MASRWGYSAAMRAITTATLGKIVSGFCGSILGIHPAPSVSTALASPRLTGFFSPKHMSFSKKTQAVLSSTIQISRINGGCQRQLHPLSLVARRSTPSDWAATRGFTSKKRPRTRAGSPLRSDGIEVGCLAFQLLQEVCDLALPGSTVLQGSL